MTERPAGAYGAALRGTLRSTAAAYGYTLTVATSIAHLSAESGSPSTSDLFLFVAGGLIGFAVLELVVSVLPQHSGARPDAAFPLAGALNVASVPAALGASVGVSDAVHAAVAWLLTPLAATAVYLAIVALQLGVVDALRQ